MTKHVAPANTETAFNHDSTLVVALELSGKSWEMGAVLPGVARRPRRHLSPRDMAGLLTQLERWKAESQRAGRTVLRVVLAYATARLWHRTGGAAWRQHVERALAPVAIGLTFASGIALMRGTEHDWRAYAVTAAATLLLSLTEVSPLLVLAGGAAALLLAGP